MRVSRSKVTFSRSRFTSMRRLMVGSFRFRSEQASSMRSMALSGRNRSVIYRSDSSTACRSTPSGIDTPWYVS